MRDPSRAPAACPCLHHPRRDELTQSEAHIRISLYVPCHANRWIRNVISLTLSVAILALAILVRFLVRSNEEPITEWSERDASAATARRRVGWARRAAGEAALSRSLPICSPAELLHFTSASAFTCCSRSPPFSSPGIDQLEIADLDIAS